MELILFLIFFASAGAIVMHLLLMPLFVILMGKVIGGKELNSPEKEQEYPTVSILVTCFEEGVAIKEKAENLLELTYPEEQLQILFVADGPTTDPKQFLAPYLESSHWQLHHYPVNRGKIAVINDAVHACTGEILVFTDVDAKLDRQSIERLVGKFTDPEIGGACGLHLLQKTRERLQNNEPEQKLYWDFDTLLKNHESRLGSITSCYGTIYAIRRERFTPVPPSVTDDAFQAMAIVRQGFRFCFEEKARAFIFPPSRNLAHEVKRRRRIVLRSLRGLLISRELFNPQKFGSYSYRLFVFKVLRRMTPLFLIMMAITSLGLLGSHIVWLYILLLQLVGYSLALLGLLDNRVNLVKIAVLKKICSTALYFCAGNLGSLLGIIDFLQGRKVDRWQSP